MNITILLNCDRSISVQLQLVLPQISFGNLIHFLTLHWRDEAKRSGHFLHHLINAREAKFAPPPKFL